MPKLSCNATVLTKSLTRNSSPECCKLCTLVGRTLTPTEELSKRFRYVLLPSMDTKPWSPDADTMMSSWSGPPRLMFSMCTEIEIFVILFGTRLTVARNLQNRLVDITRAIYSYSVAVSTLDKEILVWLLVRSIWGMNIYKLVLVWVFPVVVVSRREP